MQSNVNGAVGPEIYRRYLASVVQFHLAAAEACGLGATDYQALSLLDVDGPMTTGQLAERLGLSPSATTRAVDRLANAGLAERVPDEADRRRVLVRATGRQPEQLGEILGRVQAPIAAAITELTPAQRDGLTAYFTAATQAYREVTTGLNA
ncbi:MarR family winged helix-turn-helix transcriptional regulator [Nocardia carnea]|uniref:MarR family winged helix-turn-helix transcriptional regulator n=1 Tax=Nocardia carnea TaxID=37328 RepID=UPI002456F6BC|nr:MarR family transcriptional regulator [Nocardia carnea]